jgi:hypothetical protein
MVFGIALSGASNMSLPNVQLRIYWHSQFQRSPPPPLKKRVIPQVWFEVRI